VATLLGDLGLAPHVVSVVLGHAHIAEGATAVYARSRYHREHREALQALANEIDRIVIGDSTAARRTVVISTNTTDLFRRPGAIPSSALHMTLQAAAQQAGRIPPWEREEQQRQKNWQVSKVALSARVLHRFAVRSSA
jgi:hypothetical protein